MKKRILSLALAVLMILTVFCVKESFFFGAQIQRYYESVSSPVNNVLLYDAVNDRILFSKNADTRISIGSIVKLVTALTAFNVLSPDDIFVVGDEVEGEYLIPEASRSMIKKGQKISFLNLLYALLLPSGCDAANTIAVNCARKAANNKKMPIADALKYFTDLMNEYAADIGCKDSFFVNPDGQDAEGQYMTLNDVLTVTKKVMENELLIKVTGTSEIKVTLSSKKGKESYEWQNTNKLISKDSKYYYEYSKGLKTGYTADAGYTLVSVAERNNEKVICIIAKCSSENTRFSVAQKLCQLSLADSEFN